METSPCLSCGTPHPGRYCPACGERRLDAGDLSLRRFLARSFASVLDVDSRFGRSFLALVRRPGLLTLEYVEGRRRPYLAPIQVFLFANLAYFLSLFVVRWNTFTTPLRIHMRGTLYGDLATRLVERRLAGGASMAEYEAAFDVMVEAQARTLVILMVPLFAVFVYALYGRVRRHAVPHVVFALHAFALFLLLSPLVLFLWDRAMWLSRRVGWILGAQEQDIIVSLLIMGLWGAYLYHAARRVYGQGRAVTVAKASAMAASLLVLIVVYRLFLFFTTWLAV